MAKKKTTKKTTGKKTPARKKTTKKKTTKKAAAKKSSTRRKKAKNTSMAKAAVAKKKTTKRTTKKSTKSAKAAVSAPAAPPAAKPVTRRKAPVAKPAPPPVREPARGEDPLNDIYLDPLTDKELSKIKSGLTRKDLQYFFKLLLERRAEVLGDVESLKNDALNASGNLSNMPLHMADVGSDNYEQEFTLGLLESERRMVREIDEALMRIKNKSYGVCVQSGKPIARERLEAKPWAKYTIEIARELEKRGMMY